MSFWPGMSCEFLSIVWPSLSSCDTIVFQLVRGLESWEEWVWGSSKHASSHLTHLVVALRWWWHCDGDIYQWSDWWQQSTMRESVLCPQLLVSGGDREDWASSALHKDFFLAIDTTTLPPFWSPQSQIGRLEDQCWNKERHLSAESISRSAKNISLTSRHVHLSGTRHECMSLGTYVHGWITPPYFCFYKLHF